MLQGDEFKGHRLAGFSRGWLWDVKAVVPRIRQALVEQNRLGFGRR